VSALASIFADTDNDTSNAHAPEELLYEVFEMRQFRIALYHRSKAVVEKPRLTEGIASRCAASGADQLEDDANIGTTDRSAATTTLRMFVLMRELDNRNLH
jgi:glycine/D-amino acid oxidase-like deaminating enzyme